MRIKNLRYWILVADLLWMLAASALAIYVRYSGETGPLVFTERIQPYFLMIIAAILIWSFLYFWMTLDGFKGGWRPLAVLSQIIVAVSLLMMVLLAISFLAQ